MVNGITAIARRGLLTAVAAVAALALPASATAIDFTHAMKLGNSPPKGDLQGGEPSVAFDPNGRLTYVVAPGGGSNGGVGYWRSTDAGKTFADGRSLGSLAGGGDSDVSVGPDGTVYIADLELVANALCRSTDNGVTFDSNCDTGIATNQTGLESDREWVVPSPSDASTVYFSYHDFVGEDPLVYKSTSGGDPGTFLLCGPVLTPGSDAFTNFIPGGTNQGKMFIGRDESLYVPIAEPTNPAVVTDPYNNFYVAYARNGCDPTTQWKDVTVYSNPNAALANIFTYVDGDGGGNVYSLATGKTGKDGNHFGVYLFDSRDRGRSWSRPIRVDSGVKATALGAVAGGPHKGDVTVGYYGTSTTNNPNSADNVWRYWVAQSRNGGQTWQRTRITDKPVHWGAVCNTGILCLGGRNLLDFSSVAVNPRTGCTIAVFAGDGFNPRDDPEKTAAAPYVARQTSGCF